MARNLDTATERYREALELGRESALSRWVADSHRGLGAVARRREALSGHEAIDNRSGVGAVRVEQGRLALARGEPDRAEHCAGLARDILTTLEADHWLGRCQRLLGAVAVDRGDTAAGRRHWRRALDTLERVDTPEDELRTLEALVETCRAAGDDEQAGAWCRRGMATIRGAPDSVVERHRGWVDSTADALGLD